MLPNALPWPFRPHCHPERSEGSPSFPQRTSTGYLVEHSLIPGKTVGVCFFVIVEVKHTVGADLSARMRINLRMAGVSRRGEGGVERKGGPLW